ncbi:MAG TPA: 6-bladed beta-propeller [Longimicrobiaceae bacterium]|nr:6-bladed beta-propeller [Longimicrobiaceae bacterium]
MPATRVLKADRPRHRTARRTSAAGLLALGCALQGCGEGGPGASARAASDAPVLVPVDSVVLAESDSAYIATVSSLAVAPDGSFLVSDYQGKRLFVFGRDGRLVRSFGRSGRGPGELEQPTALALDGDSLLYVADIGAIEAFDPRTAAHRGAFPMPRMPLTLAVSSGRLFAGHADQADRGSVVWVDGDTARMKATGPFPEILKDTVIFSMAHAVALGMRGDTAATAFFVTDYVYLSDVSGRVLDSIRVPPQRRNGTHPGRLRALSRNPNQETGEAAFWGTSLPRALHWMPDGRIVLVSTDQGMVEGRWIDSSFVSVVDRRTRRSCVDARVPGPTEPSPGLALRGDTLFVVAQEVGEGTRASTVVRWYRIDTGGCRWVGE